MSDHNVYRTSSQIIAPQAIIFEGDLAMERCEYWMKVRGEDQEFAQKKILEILTKSARRIDRLRGSMS